MLMMTKTQELYYSLTRPHALKGDDNEADQAMFLLLWRFAPSLARTPAIARYWMDGQGSTLPTIGQIRQLAETEKAVREAESDDVLDDALRDAFSAGVMALRDHAGSTTTTGFDTRKAYDHWVDDPS